MAQEQTEETEEFRAALLPIMKPASRSVSNIRTERGRASSPLNRKVVELAGLEPGQQIQQQRHQRAGISQAVGGRTKGHDGKAQADKVLLMVDAPVHGHQDVEKSFSLPQQITVPDP